MDQRKNMQPMSYAAQFGNFLRNDRTYQGRTQASVYRKTHISKTTYENIEKGKWTRNTINLLGPICDELGIDRCLIPKADRLCANCQAAVVPTRAQEEAVDALTLLLEVLNGDTAHAELTFPHRGIIRTVSLLAQVAAEQLRRDQPTLQSEFDAAYGIATRHGLDQRSSLVEEARMAHAECEWAVDFLAGWIHTTIDGMGWSHNDRRRLYEEHMERIKPMHPNERLRMDGHWISRDSSAHYPPESFVADVTDHGYVSEIGRYLWYARNEEVVVTPSQLSDPPENPS